MIVKFIGCMDTTMVNINIGKLRASFLGAKLQPCKKKTLGAGFQSCKKFKYKVK